MQAEYRTYLGNKESKDIKYQFVDNVAVYRFLEEVEKLPKNNPITAFESAQEIIGFLKEQWAGLFQRYLQQQSRLKEVDLVESITATAKTLDQLVTFLTEERKNKDQAIHEILLSSHPAFDQLRNLTKTKYRLYFTSREELGAWLEAAKGYSLVEEKNWDSAQYIEYMRKLNDAKFSLIKVRSQIFEEHGKLKVFTKEDWKTKWISIEERLFEIKEPEISNEDIPF